MSISKTTKLVLNISWKLIFKIIELCTYKSMYNTGSLMSKAPKPYIKYWFPILFKFIIKGWLILEKNLHFLCMSLTTELIKISIRLDIGFGMIFGYFFLHNVIRKF